MREILPGWQRQNFVQGRVQKIERTGALWNCATIQRKVMSKIKTGSMPQVLKFLCVLLLFVITIAAKPAWAISNSFQEQANGFIEEIRSLQAKGENMDSLRFDSDRLAMCGRTMRNLQPQADALRHQIEAVETADFQTSMAKDYLSSAASSLNLCVSCLKTATDYCGQVNSSIKTALDILRGD